MNKHELIELYINKNLPLSIIASKYNVTPSALTYWIKKYKIKKSIIKYDDPLKQWIVDNCFTSKNLYNNRCNILSWWNNKEECLNQIKQQSTINSNNISEHIYWIMNDIKEYPICKSCTTKVSFKQYKSGYNEYCSQYCVTQGKERNQKISKIVNDKIDQTMIKVKTTNLERYGVEYYYQSEEFKKTAKETKLRLYGDEYYNNIQKNQNTCILKYGVKSLLELKEHQDKMFNSKVDKYGHAGPYHEEFTSSAELELLNYCNSFGLDFSKNRNVLKTKELDLYSDKLKIAIEYCGLYWHSELYKSNQYHYEKYKLCKDKNIQLITIFEDEWIYKSNIVKNILRSQLNVNNKIIYARNCTFVKCTINDSWFLNTFHLQENNNNSKYYYGLTYNNELVAMMSFGLHHRNSNTLVLNRLCFKPDIKIIGGTSKLFKNSIKELQSDIITWSDNRWYTGNVYEQIGFIKDDELKYDYSYVDLKNRNRISKQSMRKSNYNIPNNITEHEYCKSIGLYRIYDCGKIRWKFNYKKEF